MTKEGVNLSAEVFCDILFENYIAQKDKEVTMTEDIIPPSKTTGSLELIDMLATIPSTFSFAERVRQLNLKPDLEKKIFQTEFNLASHTRSSQGETLTANDEKELATEVLLLRHRFSELLLGRQHFRQAALTVLQNIYLLRNRKIFFANSSQSTERERQEALLLFSTGCQPRLPLDKTLQHLVIARIWNRILAQLSPEERRDDQFIALHGVVERLNTLRNIYMLLSTGLVRKLAAKTKAIYRQSINYDDAVQIGEIGVARAAYRYHQSCGVRFSTFAGHWVFREIQRQALEGRLIRISTNTVESCTKAAKAEDFLKFRKYSDIIAGTTALQDNLARKETPTSDCTTTALSPSKSLEARQLRSILLDTVDQKLDPKSSDIIKRRYGLPPYQGGEQSILAISKKYGVTRSSIYQIQQAAFKKLQQHLDRELL